MALETLQGVEEIGCFKMWLEKRKKDRVNRGVEGLNKK